MTREHQTDVMPQEVSDVEAFGLGIHREEDSDD